MDKIVSWLLDKAKPFACEAEETETMLGAPEIISDTKYHAFLCDKLSRLEGIRRDYLQILEIRKEQQLLDTLTDDGLAEYVAEERESLNLRLTHLAYALTKALFEGELEYERVKVEIIFDNKSEGFGAFLASALKRLCAEENLSVSGEKNLFTLSGKGAYSLLKGEKGIHQAINGESGRETACLLVYPDGKVMCDKIPDSEIKIDYFHSGGKGGQNVNKVETAIRATHQKTGISVVCQDERSQLRNKERAIERLKEKVLCFYKAEGEKEMEKARKEGESPVRVRLWDLRAKTLRDLRLDLQIPYDAGSAVLDKLLYIKEKAENR